MSEVPGFADISAVDEINKDVDDKVRKKTVKNSSGFQSMNLNYNVVKGIIKRGYKQPTPIQRKVFVIYTYVICIYKI